MTNVLDLYDQTYFSFERAAGVTNLLQCVWVYNRGIDLNGARRFHEHLQQTLLSRRVERSPLPFGRHRWVSPAGQSGPAHACACINGSHNAINGNGNRTRTDTHIGPDASAPRRRPADYRRPYR